MTDYDPNEGCDDNFDAAMNNALDLVGDDGASDCWSVSYSDEENGIYEIKFEAGTVRATPDGAEWTERF